MFSTLGGRLPKGVLYVVYIFVSRDYLTYEEFIPD